MYKYRGAFDYDLPENGTIPLLSLSKGGGGSRLPTSFLFFIILPASIFFLIFGVFLLPAPKQGSFSLLPCKYSLSFLSIIAVWSCLNKSIFPVLLASVLFFHILPAPWLPLEAAHYYNLIITHTGDNPRIKQEGTDRRKVQKCYFPSHGRSKHMQEMYTTNPIECRVSSVEWASSEHRVSIEWPSGVRRISVEWPPSDVECPSSDLRVTLRTVTRWSLYGHSMDTRQTLDITRWTLDKHSTLDTRWHWWCTCVGFTRTSKLL